MLHFIELIIALSIIIFIALQTPTDNTVLRLLLETGLFENYGQGKFFLIRLTWTLIFLFIVLLILINAF